jgi:aryl-alcohol dehydrogenase-like predicted oxidoreductase
VPYDVGLEAVDELRKLLPAGASLSQLALRWILMFPEVTCTIPGAKTADQARANTAAASLPPLSAATMAAVKEIYDRRIRPHVQDSW